MKYKQSVRHRILVWLTKHISKKFNKWANDTFIFIDDLDEYFKPPFIHKDITVLEVL